MKASGKVSGFLKTCYGGVKNRKYSFRLLSGTDLNKIGKGKEYEVEIEELVRKIGDLGYQKQKIEEGVSELLKQRDDYVGQIDKYQDLNEGLIGRVGELENICDFRNKKIKELRTKARKRDREDLEFQRKVYSETAEQSELSYVVIEGLKTVIATSKGFKEIFHFKEDLIGQNYSSVLKVPKDTKNYADHMVDIFKDPRKIKKQTTIINGNGEEKLVIFEKMRPHHLRISNREEGREVNAFYTTVYVHEIGTIERAGGVVKRIMHPLGKSGKIGTLAHLVAEHELNKSKIKTEETVKRIISGKDINKKSKKKKTGR